MKNGIMHIYMINLLNPYEYNSSNLQNYDHWVYDSCNNYVLEEDIKYDYSFSFCIHYYYNSVQRKYYSINDKINFKWPFVKDIKDNFQISENSFFITYIERCSNNSFINNIFGKCYSDEKINNFFNIFNSIFISIVDNKIEISDDKNPIKKYSHQIHNNLKNDEKYYSFYEMEFIQFNYEENGAFYRKNKINSYMLEENRISKINNDIYNSNKIFAAYSFRFKKYINEFRKQEHKIFIIFRIIFTNIISVYSIFYILNLFLNEITQTSDFLFFINNNNDLLIQKDINYNRSKILSIKSVLNSNESNENNNQYNSLQSSYLGNFKNNNNMSSNFFTSFNRDNISKFNKKSEIIDSVEKEENNENNFSKKSENIVFINNGTFMDANLNHKNNLTNINIFEKTKSMKFNHKKNDLNDLEHNNKIFTYRKGKKDIDINTFNNQNKYLKLKDKNSEYNSMRNDINFDNGSKQRIMNNSSISLMKELNNKNNININQQKELLLLNNNNINIYSPQSNSNMNNIKIISKKKESTIDLLNHCNSNKKYSVSTKHNIKKFLIENRLNNSLINIKNKSHEKNKHIHHKERRSTLYKEMLDDNYSQYSLPKKMRDNFKKNNKLSKLTGNRTKKEKIRQDYEEYIKKKKTDIQNSTNILYNPKNYTNKSFNFEKSMKIKTKVFWNYFCFWNNNKNPIKLMSLFRKKLLSEEYLYIIHLRLLIFKRIFESKSSLDVKGLIEELYHNY